MVGLRRRGRGRSRRWRGWYCLRRCRVRIGWVGARRRTDDLENEYRIGVDPASGCGGLGEDGIDGDVLFRNGLNGSHFEAVFPEDASRLAQRVTYETRTLISGGRRSERNQEVQRRTVDLNGRGRRLLGQHLVRLRPRAVNLDNVAYRQPTLDGRDLRGARARADHVRNLNLRRAQAHQHVDVLTHFDPSLRGRHLRDDLVGRILGVEKPAFDLDLQPEAAGDALRRVHWTPHQVGHGLLTAVDSEADGGNGADQRQI